MEYISDDAVSPTPALGLVPIVVGITGHRDILVEDRSVLRGALRRELDRLALENPHSPKLLLSGLAEGADRLAAFCALEAGWQLGAVLPLPQADYETDFESAESLAEFRYLLSRAAWVKVAGAAQTQIRPTCYGALGRKLPEKENR